jgi:hypothetical protein
MRRVLIIIIFIFPGLYCFPQATGSAPRSVFQDENLRAIGTLKPYSSGGYGFDNRYEGVRGTPMYSDSLLPSLLLIKGQSSYVRLVADIDLINNDIVYRQSSTGKLFVIPIEFVEEFIITKNGTDIVFRTTSGKVFDKEMKETRFIQVLNESPVQLVKMPIKSFVQANYKGAYSADRRYDEYLATEKYFLSGPDNVFHQIQLSKRSVIKIYPDKKKVIDTQPGEKEFPDKEKMIISLVQKL